MLSDFASLANGPLKQYPLRRQTLTQGFLEHGIEVTTSGHLNPYSLGQAWEPGSPGFFRCLLIRGSLTVRELGMTEGKLMHCCWVPPRALDRSRHGRLILQTVSVGALIGE
jgi:hypothetical protein